MKPYINDTELPIFPKKQAKEKQADVVGDSLCSVQREDLMLTQGTPGPAGDTAPYATGDEPWAPGAGRPLSWAFRVLCNEGE